MIWNTWEHPEISIAGVQMTANFRFVSLSLEGEKPVAGDLLFAKMNRGRVGIFTVVKAGVDQIRPPSWTAEAYCIDCLLQGILGDVVASLENHSPDSPKQWLAGQSPDRPFVSTQ